mgnify:CR=1 FL=1
MSLLLLLQNPPSAPPPPGSSDKARPISDITVGNWRTQNDDAVSLFGQIDEAVADDGDFVKSPASPATIETYEALLSPVDDPLVATGHVIRYRLKKNAGGGDALSTRVRLMQGSTVIATWVHSNVDEIPEIIAQTLSASEANAISDYSNLRLRFDVAKGGVQVLASDTTIASDSLKVDEGLF